MTHRRLAAGLVAALTLVAAHVLADETPSPSVRAACMPSVRILCPAELKAHNFKAIKACLREKIDQASPECQTAVHAAQDAEKKKPKG